MATGPQVGTAWVQITPSFQGFGSSLLTGMTGDLTGAARRAGDDAGDAGGRAFTGSFNDRVDQLADSMSGIGAAAGAGVAGAFAVGLTAAMDASAATAKVTAQLGLTEAESQRVGQVAGDVFTAGFGGSMAEASAAVGAVASSVEDLGSVSDKELTQLSTTAAALAETFEWDVGEAANAAGALVRTGLVDNATEGFDAIARAAQTLPAAMRADIPAVVAEYGIHFSRIGLDAQTAFGMLSQYVAAGGRDIDQAADVLHEFARITSEETDTAAEAFRALGLDSSQMLADIAKGGPAAESALSATLAALRGMEDPAEQAALGVELFGDMAGEGAEALWAMDPATAAATSGMDEMDGASKRLTEGLADDPARVFSSSIRSLTQSLSAGLAPALQSAAGWAKDNQSTIAALAVALGAVVATVAATSAALRIYQGVMMAIRVATVAWAAVQWVLNAAFWANPITWVIAGIIALIAIIVAAVVYWDEIVAAVTAAWDWILQATQAAWDWLVAAFASMWDGIVSGVQAAWDWIVGIISGAWNWIVGIFQQYHPVGIIMSHWDSIKAATSSAWQAVLSFIRGVWTSIVSSVTGAASRVWSAITGTWSRVRSATSAAFSAVRSAISNALTGALNAVRGIGGRFVSIGRDIVAGIVRGVRNAASSLFGSLRSMARNALNSAKSALGIGSPSKLFAMEVGQWLPAGIEMGIDRGQGDLDQRVEDMVQAPDPPVVRATVATGGAAEPAPVILRADGSRASQALLELLRHSIRTDLGGDVNRLGTAR